MESQQRAAINSLKNELIEALGGLTTALFISDLDRNAVISAGEREIVESLKTSQDKLLRLFDSLQHNDKGWQAIISFLKEHHKNGLAEKLAKTASDHLLETDQLSGSSNTVRGAVAQGGSVSKVNSDDKHIRFDFVPEELPVWSLNGVGPFMCDRTEAERLTHSNRAFQNCSKPKGLVLIINNYKFDKSTGLADFPLSYKIDEQLVVLWQKLGYEGLVARNLTAKQMWNELLSFAGDPRLDVCHSAIVIVMSHGDESGIYGVDGKTVSAEKICERFSEDNCRYDMDEKPKYFIFDACRGDKTMAAGHTSDEIEPRITTVWLDEVDEVVAAGKRGPPANTLVTYACAPGYESYRSGNGENSFLMDRIIEVFQYRAHTEHVISMLKTVDEMLSVKQGKNKQQPDTVDRHKKYFYLFPGYFKD